jgi:hypothetical protein
VVNLPSNIKEIRLWDDAIDKSKIRSGKENYNGMRLVLIGFNFPCTWTTLEIGDLKQILREWIKGEELQYPPEQGFKGRWMLFDVIKKIFEEGKNETTGNERTILSGDTRATGDPEKVAERNGLIPYLQ